VVNGNVISDGSLNITASENNISTGSFLYLAASGSFPAFFQIFKTKLKFIYLRTRIYIYIYISIYIYHISIYIYIDIHIHIESNMDLNSIIHLYTSRSCVYNHHTFYTSKFSPKL
jgi:hypothetical protein